MDPIMGGMISGGLGLIGSIFGQNQTNKFAEQENEKARQFNSAQTLQQQQFQEQMSSTAYQRASADMQKAGLNPILAAGASSSTPSGAAATTMPTQKTSALKEVGPAMDRIVSSALSAKTFEKMIDEIANLKTTRANIEAHTATERERPALVREVTHETSQRASRTGHEVGIRRNEAIKAANEENVRKNYPFIDQAPMWGRAASDTIRPIGDIISSASGAARTISGIRAGSWSHRFPDKMEEFIPGLNKGDPSYRTTKYKRGSKP